MTIETLEEELADEEGNYDEARGADTHTRVIASAADSVEELIEELGLRERGPDEVDAVEILEALAERAQDDTDRHLILLLAGAAEQLRDVATELPAEQAALLTGLATQLRDAQSLEDLDSILSAYEDHPDPAIGHGATHAREILRDGNETIYNHETSPIADVAADPDDPPEEQRGRAVVSVAAIDTAGAVGGAAAGVFFFGVGAGPGAVGGAVSTSVTSLTQRALNRLFKLS